MVLVLKKKEASSHLFWRSYVSAIQNEEIPDNNRRQTQTFYISLKEVWCNKFH